MAQPFYNLQSPVFSCVPGWLQCVPEVLLPSAHSLRSPQGSACCRDPSGSSLPTRAPGPRHFWDLALQKQGTVGKSQRPAPFPHIPWASAPNSVHPPPAVPAASSLSPLCPLPKACGPLAALSHHPVFILELACSGLASLWPWDPGPGLGRASAGLQGSALQWAGQAASGREAGRGDLAVRERTRPERESLGQCSIPGREVRS